MGLELEHSLYRCVCVWSHCTMLRGGGGGGGGGLKDDKVQALFDPQPTFYTEVLYSAGNYL